ncbi:sensor histidine kinase [Chitinimonas sp. BJYL2]|uniref:sensor histidine kinase n=1 Tax=Chitinimonas sp. BJYL2 TaxID=2976696 RepID=UPI0022B4F58D|nr:histidine kinase [Chitinimonas sp. BJYL2]
MTQLVLAPPPIGQVRRALWRNLLVTLAINTLAGIFFALFSDSPLWRLMLTSHVIGLTVFVAVTFIFNVVKPSPQREPLYFFAAVALAGLIGLAFNWLIRFRLDELLAMVRQYPSYLLISLVALMLAAAVVASILWSREKASRLEAAFHLEQARNGEQDRQLVQAQLRMLQAQIEPHFLFNTLASVQSLIDVSPGTAKQMLGLFNDYLRASLTRTRHAEGTVGQEIELLEAYLGILQIRMADRLRFEIDCPAVLRDTPLPPMLIQPLVENAIRHGLEPKVEGGLVRIALATTGEALHITVTDTGLGLSRAETGQGLGLANVRARLATLYGEQAQLMLQANPAGGVTATMTLPLQHD